MRIKGKYLDANKQPLRTGFYDYVNGGIFYLFREKEGWAGESLKGLIFRVVPTLTYEYAQRDSNDLEGLTQEQRDFINSKPKRKPRKIQSSPSLLPSQRNMVPMGGGDDDIFMHQPDNYDNL